MHDSRQIKTQRPQISQNNVLVKSLENILQNYSAICFDTSAFPDLSLLSSLYGRHNVMRYATEHIELLNWAQTNSKLFFTHESGYHEINLTADVQYHESRLYNEYSNSLHRDRFMDGVQNFLQGLTQNHIIMGDVTTPGSIFHKVVGEYFSLLKKLDVGLELRSKFENREFSYGQKQTDVDLYNFAMILTAATGIFGQQLFELPADSFPQYLMLTNDIDYSRMLHTLLCFLGTDSLAHYRELVSQTIETTFVSQNQSEGKKYIMRVSTEWFDKNQQISPQDNQAIFYDLLSKENVTRLIKKYPMNTTPLKSPQVLFNNIITGPLNEEISQNLENIQNLLHLPTSYGIEEVSMVNTQKRKYVKSGRYSKKTISLDKSDLPESIDISSRGVSSQYESPQSEEQKPMKKEFMLSFTPDQIGILYNTIGFIPANNPQKTLDEVILSYNQGKLSERLQSLALIETLIASAPPEEYASLPRVMGDKETLSGLIHAKHGMYDTFIREFKEDNHLSDLAQAATFYATVAMLGKHGYSIPQIKPTVEALYNIVSPQAAVFKESIHAHQQEIQKLTGEIESLHNKLSSSQKQLDNSQQQFYHCKTILESLEHAGIGVLEFIPVSSKTGDPDDPNDPVVASGNTLVTSEKPLYQRAAEGVYQKIKESADSEGNIPKTTVYKIVGNAKLFRDYLIAKREDHPCLAKLNFGHGNGKPFHLEQISPEVITGYYQSNKRLNYAVIIEKYLG